MPDWVLNICVPAAIIIVLAVGVLYLKKNQVVEGQQPTPKLKVKVDPLGIIAWIEHQHAKSSAKRKYGEAQTERHVGNALAGRYNRPYFDPENWPAIIAAVIAIAVVVVIVVVAAKGSGLIPRKVIVKSGPMPMSEKFEVEPITTYSLDKLTTPPYMGQVDTVQRVYTCQSGVKVQLYVVGGTLIIDNFTGKNILLTRSENIPGQVTVQCKRSGDLAISVSYSIAAPVIAEPTTAPTQVTTQIPTQIVEIQATPTVQSFLAVPAPTSGQYFLVQVVHGGIYGKASLWTPLSGGSESYYGLVTTAGCGANVPLPNDSEVYALVDVNQPVYGPEVVGSDNGVTIACDGYNNTILYVVIVR